jgi:hypothetical protein
VVMTVSTILHNLSSNHGKAAFVWDNFSVRADTHIHNVLLVGLRLSPLGTAATTDQLYQPQRAGDSDCGMKIGRGNRSTRRKPATMPLSPPQMPHDLTRARTRAAAVRSRRLTAWAMARPSAVFCSSVHMHFQKQLDSLLEGVRYPYAFCLKWILFWGSQKWRLWV